MKHVGLSRSPGSTSPSAHRDQPRWLGHARTQVRSSTTVTAVPSATCSSTPKRRWPVPAQAPVACFRGRPPSPVEHMRIGPLATIATRPDKSQRGLAELTEEWRERPGAMLLESAKWPALGIGSETRRLASARKGSAPSRCFPSALWTSDTRAVSAGNVRPRGHARSSGDPWDKGPRCRNSRLSSGGHGRTRSAGAVPDAPRGCNSRVTCLWGRAGPRGTSPARAKLIREGQARRKHTRGRGQIAKSEGARRRNCGDRRPNGQLLRWLRPDL
jgi:hypothetical protein